MDPVIAGRSEDRFQYDAPADELVPYGFEDLTIGSADVRLAIQFSSMDGIAGNQAMVRRQNDDEALLENGELMKAVRELAWDADDGDFKIALLE